MSFSISFVKISFDFFFNFVLNVVFKFISITTVVFNFVMNFVFNFIFNMIALLRDKMNKKLDRYRAYERDTFSIGRKYETNSNPYR
jgi:hypothetical protein